MDRQYLNHPAMKKNAAYMSSAGDIKISCKQMSWSSEHTPKMLGLRGVHFHVAVCSTGRLLGTFVSRPPYSKTVSQSS